MHLAKNPGKTFLSQGQNVLIPVLLILLVSIFYLATLAPTVLWGDDAFFQIAAVTGYLPPNGNNHWLWLQLARLFTTLPIGNMAFRVNLLSAVAAAMTVGVMYGVALALKMSWRAALVTAVSLTIAHTFWTHAVRAEVYTVFTLLMAGQLWLWFRWQADQPIYLYAAFFLLGPSCLGHQMGVLLMPAMMLLVWKRRHWLTRIDWLKLLIFFAFGLVPFWSIMNFDIGNRAGTSLVQSVYLYFTHAGGDYTDSFLDFSINFLVRDISLWLGFLGLQFVGVAFIAGVVGIVTVWRQGMPTASWLSITVLYVTTVLFAISYRVNDHFVFFLPSYLAFVLFIGAGWESVESFVKNRWPRMSWLIYLCLFAIPLLSYYTLPKILINLDVNPLGVRQLPGREPNMFFLWPAKNGYMGAEEYGRNALESLPERAVLLGDHTPIQTVRYLQAVEGARPDVTIIQVQVGKDLAPVVNQFEPGTDIYLADINPNYYNFSNLPGIHLEPVGYIYELVE